MMHRRRLLSLAAWPLALPRPAAALEAPAGDVLLTVSGKLRHTNRQGQAVFDLPMLERLPQTTYTARTPWFVQPREFTGPLMRDLLAAVGAHGTRLRALALNDYRVDIPMDDVQRWNVIVARLTDGRPMTVREKGPLMVMYPFEQESALRSTLYYSRCAWQLTGLEVQ